MNEQNSLYAWIGADRCYQAASEEFSAYWQLEEGFVGQPLAELHGKLHGKKLIQLLDKAERQGQARVALRTVGRGECWQVQVYWNPQQNVFLLSMLPDHRLISTETQPVTPEGAGVLVGREIFLQQFQQQMEQSRIRQGSLALICIDLDRFQWINETLGSDTGDELLLEIASRLRSVVREHDLVARFSGDTFIMMIRGMHSAEDAESIAHRVVERLSHGIYIDRRELFVSASAGVAIFPQHGRDEQQLLRNADLAMYAAKRAGRNTYCLFSSALAGEPQAAQLPSDDFAAALSGSQFSLMYCPIYNNSLHRLCGAQVMPGWHHPQLGWLSGRELMPLAVAANLTDPFNQWLIDHLLEVQPLLQTLNGCQLLLLRLEEAQLTSAKLIAQLSEAIARDGLDAGGLVLELDAAVALAHDGTVFDLQDLGFRIALRGVNAVNWEQSGMQDLQPDWLKLDAQQVQGLNEPSNRTAALLGLAAPTVPLMAEGVNSAGQLTQLMTQGCALMQGRYFSELLNIEQLAQWLELEQSGVLNS
ncbi:GGDEF domain-containing protein [Marinobacterium arenosum]|uniref:GGDEF domain-containing protein n=1 Tax=Marinobacterium arenosum TaxID=2862496 RepID=UPI001C96E1AD|nr:diguanylate cyclase [Marinobacterium arenosum]MBY4676482.1 diguanylate cyclase [Marinobacterium arenosum]